MSTKVSLNTGPGGKGPATDYSMFLEMKKRRVLTIGVPVKSGLIGSDGKPALSDRPMQRGFTDNMVTPRLHVHGAYKNFMNANA
jgi:hypothetical protein